LVQGLLVHKSLTLSQQVLQLPAMVLLVAVVVVVLVVVVAAASAEGAQSSFDTFGVTVRLPNWSFSGIAGNVAPFGHLIL
jgi:hypothetical protein